MKSIYIDCSMGAAGDMLTGALLELLDEEKRSDFVKKFNFLIEGVTMQIEPMEKCGIAGTHVSIKVNGAEEDEHLHEHSHGHGHVNHSHTHNGMAEIEHLVNEHMDLPEDVREDILNVYKIIADAESKVHGVPVTDIHFHEVGTKDALADVSAVCMLMKMIGAKRVTVSPVNTGSGTVKCAHGVLPVPAPATAEILKGVPAYSNGIESELCTPTGAALIKYFATEFGDMPVMVTEKIGYGMGRKDFDQANCVRIMMGE